MRKTLFLILGAIAILGCPNREKAPTDTAATTSTTSTTYTDTTATTSTAPPTTEYKLDHYKFWKVRATKPMAPVQVLLKGQFDKAPWPADVVSIEYLGNPAEKIVGDAPHAPIQNERLHYVAYAIKSTEKQPERTVRVTNQFAPNGEEWRLDSAAWLLTPADKQLNDNTQQPPPGDHFVCYAVVDGKPFPKKVTLIDQFDRQPGGSPENIDTLTPKYLCVPVEKTLKAPEPIRDRDTHLALYEFKPPTPRQITAYTQDQFGRQQLKVDPESRYQFLGVPSHKQWPVK